VGQDGLEVCVVQFPEGSPACSDCVCI
jgi:hypothetical protein